MIKKISDEQVHELNISLVKPIIEDINQIDLAKLSPAEREHVSKILFAIQSDNSPDMKDYGFRFEFPVKEPEEGSKSIPFAIEVVEEKSGEYERYLSDERDFNNKELDAYILIGEWFLPNYASAELKLVVKDALERFKKSDRSGATHEVRSYFEKTEAPELAHSTRYITEGEFYQEWETALDKMIAAFDGGDTDGFKLFGRLFRSLWD